MDIKFSEMESVPFIRLDGRLDAVGARELDKKMLDYPAEATHAIIDMGNVNYVSSVGIRSLLSIEKMLRRRGGRSVMCRVGDNAMNALSMAGLDRSVVIYESAKDALGHIKSERMSVSTKDKFESCGREYEYMEYPDSNSILEIWGSRSENFSGGINYKSFEQLFLDELPLGFGLAGCTFSGEDTPCAGEFLAAGNLAASMAADGNSVPDYMIANDSSRLELSALSVVGIEGRPRFELKLAGEKIFSMVDIVEDMFKAAEKAVGSNPDRIAFCVYSEAKKLYCSHYSDEEDIIAGKRITEPQSPRAALIVGCAERHNTSGNNIVEKREEYRIGGDLYCRMNAVLLRDYDESYINKPYNEIIDKIADLEKLAGVANISPDSDIGSLASWVFVPDDVRPGTHKRIEIEYENGEEFPEEYNIIIRRIYNDSERVSLRPLAGGFSARTFLVDSYDENGRRQLPTVLKVAPDEAITREKDSYEQYVRKFILNNSTTIMGTSSYGGYAGLRYNFVGIGGKDNRIYWLEKFYQEQPAEKIIEIFDRVFTDVLKPWYGQPRLTPIRPYHEHDPSRIFKSISEDAESEQGISPGDPEIDCPYLGRKIINPFYFLENEFPKRKDFELQWYKSVIHGDLNMKNILLDNDENIYVIDFSETRESNIVSDFARLEPILKFEMTRVESEKDIEQLLEFEQGLLAQNLISELPRFTYNGDDPMVEKAYLTISRLRNFADRTTLFEYDMRPYLLALLEWTLPVASYIGFPPLRKRFAAFSAALIIEKIMELDEEFRNK